jgi:hypothetical protein
VGNGVHEIDFGIGGVRFKDIKLHKLQVFEVCVYANILPLVRQGSVHLPIQNSDNAIDEYHRVCRV